MLSFSHLFRELISLDNISIQTYSYDAIINLSDSQSFLKKVKKVIKYFEYNNVSFRHEEL
jgi:hypothetical protein